MQKENKTEIQLLNGILSNCSGTIAGLVFSKTGVLYQKKTIIKKERIIRRNER